MSAGPIPVTVEFVAGAPPISLKRLDETLLEYGVLERDEDREVLDDEVVPVADWAFGERTCPYVKAMVSGWAKDKPTGRHPWLVAQTIRLSAAYRLSCITEADYMAAREVLAARFRTRLNVGAKRKEAPGEIAGAFAWAQSKVASFSDARARDELGSHTHPDEIPVVQHDPVALDRVDDVFTGWLGDLYDLQVLHAVLAVAAAALHLDGDPAWLLVVGGSGMTKTETITPLAAIGAILTSTIGSEGVLLSGTSSRERAENASGGLLRQVGKRGMLVLKDFTTILSMNRDARAVVLAALREIFDGRWDRPIGSDGGQTLTWVGHCVLIGAVTTKWDASHGVIAAMGDRFLLVRPPSEHAEAAGRAALEAAGHEQQMRADLSAAVGGLLQHLDVEAVEKVEPPVEFILPLANVVTWARTAVEVDYKGDVESAHDREAPTRFAKELATLYRGARLIGLNDHRAQALVLRVARDSMPPGRRNVLGALVTQTAPSTTVEIAGHLDEPRTSVDRTLQKLQALRLVTHFAGAPNPAWRWSLAAGVDTAVVAALCLPGNVGERTPIAHSASTEDDLWDSFSSTSSTHTRYDYFPGRQTGWSA